MSMFVVGQPICLRKVAELDTDKIKVEFLNIGELLEGMSIEQWLMRHSLNKVLAGTDFESHLHKAVKLEILWNFEGAYIFPL